MSLEETIAANTAAVIALTAAIQASSVGASAVNTTSLVAGSPLPQNGAAVKGLEAALSAAAGVAAATAVTAAGQPALADAAALAASVTVTDVLNLASQLIAAKGKPALKEALSEYNVKSIQAIAPEKLQAALASIQKALDAPVAAA